jgi:hypothetical protein
MQSNITYNFFTGLYDSTLLGGEFANCHGQGSTPDDAVDSLKLRVNQLRRLRDGIDKYLYSK